MYYLSPPPPSMLALVITSVTLSFASSLHFKGSMNSLGQSPMPTMFGRKNQITCPGPWHSLC